MNASGWRVLLVGDEQATLRALRAGLFHYGYCVTEAQTCTTALDLVRRKTADSVLLDLDLRDIDGLEVMRHVQGCGSVVPIITTSNRNDEGSKVAALDSGADDHVTKPFGMDELLARIRAAQRHQLQQQGERPVFHCGDLKVDLVRRVVTVRDRELKLSPREYGRLRRLVGHAGKVVIPQHILRDVWGHDTAEQYIRISIMVLRKKIEDDIEHTRYITTGERGRLSAAGARPSVSLPMQSNAAAAICVMDP